MRHGDFKWDEDGAPAGELKIWVDLRTQLISVFRGGHEIGTAVIVYGTESMESPTGRFPILTKSRDYHSRTYDAPMPYSMFINNTGVALHGSPMSSRRATHGCVGLPVEFARLLFSAAKIGDVVEIVRSGPNPTAATRPTLKS
jgi:lipoprotein-anchoring transpeptidase ErfK/SrfK